MVQADPITVATIWHFMQRVCREMRETMERTAADPLATSLHDLGYGIWDAQARVIAIPEGFPCRLISSTFPIKAVLSKFAGRIYPGDVFMTNHPFLAGAVHLYDWVFIRPIFYKDELVFFTCMGTHVPDNGGAQLGHLFLAYDSIAEGLNIPPIKVMEKDQEKEDILDLILCNNRMPDLMRREMRSLMGSITLAERRLIELLDKYGKETVFASIEEMISRTEKAVRAEVAKWPEGVYYAEAQMDDDGFELGVPVTVRCKLTIKDGEATFDFSDSDEQRKGNINAVYSMTLSHTLCCSFVFLGTELSAYHNEGSLRPFHVITREGTILNSRPGALTAATPGRIGNLIFPCVLSVLSQALPQRAVATWGRGTCAFLPVGIDPRTNKTYVRSSFCAIGGAGAVYGYDGYQCCCLGDTLGAVSKADVEDEMVRFPWRVKTYEFLTDSCGAGKWRGAPGIWWEIVNEGGDCLAHGSGGGLHTQVQGQQGGHPTPFGKGYTLHGTERVDVEHGHVERHFKDRDIIVSLGGGGAGVGPPEERDPEAVRMDVKNELVSIEAARDIYKVVLVADSMEIDYDATQRLRGKN